VQFALLGAFIVIIPILLTSSRLLEAGRNVLIEHEIIDLSDECNLRVNEMREDMSYLARDVRRAIKEANDQPPEVLVQQLNKEVGPLPSTMRPNPIPDSVRESRQKYMAGTVVGFYVFRAGEKAGEIEVLANKPGPDDAPQPAPQDGLRECLNDVVVRAVRSQSYNSALHLQAVRRDHAARCLIAIGGLVAGGTKARPILAAVIIDFTRYIDNRRRISPRHAYIVTNPEGVVLIHPDPEVASKSAKLPELIPWEYPTDDQGESWFAPFTDATAQDRRLALAVHKGGARLPMIAVPGLTTAYQKCNFGEAIEKRIGNRERAGTALCELNDRLSLETERDPFLRCGEVAVGNSYVEVAHRDPARLKPIRDIINKWFAEYVPNKKPAWTVVLDCRTFQGQLTPLRVDLNDQDPLPWLVVATSKEELQEDIDDRFEQVRNNWVLPTLGIASLLGIIMVVTLTHSVRRLASAARHLSAEKDDIRVPLGGPYEVSQLAHTLDDLAHRVHERDRQLGDRAARYETILRAAGEGIIITNSGGVVEEVNKAAGRMFGYRPEEMIGMPVTSLVSNPDSLTAIDSSMPAPNSVSRALDNIQGKRKDGSLLWLEIGMKPVSLRDRVVVTCVFRDVSQRKEAEENIRRMNDDLENRVRTRTAELQEAKGKLEVALRLAEAASRAKDTFVANMSHELRQPMHIIIGFTEALKEEAEDLGAANILPDLDKILAAAKHLLELINDILDLAKISAGRMDLAIGHFELPKMIEDVHTLVSPLAAKNENKFVVDAPADLGEMIADERRVRQILINLLSNAFKFTLKGTVTLSVSKVTDAGREWVRFAISDTGKGMTAEQVSRLFQRFYQADDSTTREQGGTGLGLTITQSFTELMNGQPVKVTSVVGRGSEFVVMLPTEVIAPTGPRTTRPALVPATPPTPKVKAEANGRTVLVIDDDSMVHELMSRFLTKEGFNVVQAESGEEGFRLAQTLRPCVITLDVMMPERDGWSILTRLKADPATSDIPVVMLTIVDDRGRGFALGAADYLTKPIDWQRLGVILNRYLTPGRSDSVLVIDDDQENREVVARFLLREGCKVVNACNGEEGLTEFASERPALILLDLMMPVLDGFGFLDELEKRYPGNGVPVVVLTAKELTSADFDKLNGRVTRILEKGDLTHLDKLMEVVRHHARPLAKKPAVAEEPRS